MSVAQLLVDELVAEGGTLRVPRKRWDNSETPDYRHRALLAERLGKVPEGKRLIVTEAGNELEIRLVDTPGGLGGRPELGEISVPPRIGKYHRAARSFRDLRERHEVSRPLIGRAARIIHTVAIEAARRGWEVHTPAESPNGYGRRGWTGAKNGHLGIGAEGHRFWLRLREEGVQTRGPWEQEVRWFRNVSRDSWAYRGRDIPTGSFDAGATGRLMLQLHCDTWWMHRGRQSRWADRQSWALEDRLAHVFREIEERVAEAERVASEKRLEAERLAEVARRDADLREREWHRLMDLATHRLLEQHRVTDLLDQIQRWDRAARVGRYCDAMEASHGGHAATGEWIAWARSYAEELDPLSAPPIAPAPPEITPEVLQAHLPTGWSAAGPGRGGDPRLVR